MSTRLQGNRWWTLLAMCFALFMIMLDNTVVNVALPSIQRDLDATPAGLEWTINAYVLSFAVLIMLGGKLGDRFGRKRMFIVGLLIFTVMSAACALSDSEGMLVAARALQGVGGALMNPLSLSIIVAAFPREQVGTAIGVWAGVSALGLAVGPVVGGLLVDHVGWSAVFWINVPIGVIAAAVTVLAVRESRDPRSTTLDLPGTVLVTGGLFLLVWALIETNRHAWGSLYTLSFLAGAAVALALFVAWEARAPEPMIPLGFFRRRAFSGSALVVAFVGLGLFGVIFFLTLYFQNVKGWSPTKAGLAALPLTLMIMLVGPLAGKLLKRFGPRALMTTGMLLVTGGLAGLTQLQPDTSYMRIWPFYSMIGIGMALAMPATSTTGMSAVPSDKAGVASGVINASRQVGAALGIAILGAVGSAIAVSQWTDSLRAGPAAARAAGGRLQELVIGGQGAVVGRAVGGQLGEQAGARAQAEAFSAFVAGVRGAMWVAAGLTLLAALVAFVALRGVPRPEAAAGPAGVAPEPRPVEALSPAE